jgi:hypothetical protein
MPSDLHDIMIFLLSAAAGGCGQLLLLISRSSTRQTNISGKPSSSEGKLSSAPTSSRTTAMALVFCTAPATLIFLFAAASMVKSADGPAAIAVLLLIGQLTLGGLYLFRLLPQKNADFEGSDRGNS